MSRLLQLPRELRNVIYEHYFRAEEGFSYDFVTNKFRQADSQPIDLSLVLTCHQIAAETHGLALRINTLRFATFHSDATQKHACLLHFINKDVHYQKHELLGCAAFQVLSQEQAQMVKSLYPRFAPVVDHWMSEGKIVTPNGLRHGGEPPSLWRDFVDFTFSLISQEPEYIRLSKTPESPVRWFGGKEALTIHQVKPTPWQFPDAEELAKLEVFAVGLDRYQNVKYTYSAASVALRWLHSLPKATRDDIRKIALIEDRESIAFPESHGRGFIEICQDHPQLKVERVVSLWRTGFPMSKFGRDTHLRGDRDYIDRGLMEVQGCDAYFITKGLGAWIMEASILPSLGMPDGSFTLVFDGEPLPEKTAATFRVVQRDVAYQTALDACYARGLLPQPSWVTRRLCTTGFMYEGLPEVVAAISMHSALIRTNFPLCEPYDVEQMLRERKGWTFEQWEWGWPTHEPRDFQTEAPLPPWHYLRWQHVIE